MLVYKSLKDGFDYVPSTERNEAEPFSVKLKRLEIPELAELQDLLVTRTSTEVRNNYGVYWVNTCLKGIIDWKGLIDINNLPIAMEKTSAGTITHNSLNKIPYAMIEEIATVIIAISTDPSTIKVFES